MASTTPDLAPRTMTAQLEDVRGVVGLGDAELPPEAACKLAEKMQLAPATYDAATDTVAVAVPCTRSDILHAVDVAEDIGIAYGRRPARGRSSYPFARQRQGWPAAGFRRVLGRKQARRGERRTAPSAMPPPHAAAGPARCSKLAGHALGACSLPACAVLSNIQ